MSNSKQRKFVRELYRRLQERYKIPQCPLRYDPNKPWELAIAVILSAQCTDERVNQVTPDLFAEFKHLRDYYQKPLDRLEKLIYSSGFYKNKAHSIRGFANMLDKEMKGQLPTDLKSLQQLPGVGRKTANVIQNELFKIADGIVVDTHVARISRLWQLTRHEPSKAAQIEKDLVEVIPKDYWLYWSLYLIFLGREYCKARTPLCEPCFLNDICPAAKLPA